MITLPYNPQIASALVDNNVHFSVYNREIRIHRASTPAGVTFADWVALSKGEIAYIPQAPQLTIIPATDAIEVTFHEPRMRAIATGKLVVKNGRLLFVYEPADEGLLRALSTLHIPIQEEPKI